MNGGKDAAKSKTIWGLIALALIWANDFFMLGLDDMLSGLAEDPEKLAMYVAAIVTAWGRISANTRITSIFGYKIVKEEEDAK